MGLNIALLESFVLVATLGSFSAAARQLGLTQPAVSSQIKSLEQEFGALLLSRTRGKVILTPAGRTALRHARKMLSDYNSMLAEIPRSSGKVAGVLLVGAGTVSGGFFLPPLIGMFKETYPEVVISLEVRDSDSVIDELKHKRIELGFVGKEVQDPGIAKEPMGSEELVLITPSEHALAPAGSGEWASLAGEPFVARKPTSGTRQCVEAVIRKKGEPPGGLDVVAELGTNLAVISAVEAGVGISIVSRKVAEYARIRGNISVLELSDTKLIREFYAIYLKDQPLSVAASTFLEFCLESLK